MSCGERRNSAPFKKSPKETKYVSNVTYFGKPVYTYSLKQGNRGRLPGALRVIRIDIDKDIEGWTPHPYLCRDRNLIERFFNKIKKCRRVATRYDKHAANYLAFVKVACIRLWLRFFECTT